jgi:anaerobic magnesium-protoporphyrin IX monomethyl ester cyclase
MKVLLINPPIDNMITTNIPSYAEEERGYNPPLGLMYVAAYAEQHTDCEIEILDMLAEEITYNQLESELRRRKPDIVGITTTTFTLIDAMIVVRIVKATDTGIKVVLGGPHVHIYPEETIRLPEVDFLILGEGELPFTELLQNIDSYESLKGVRGIVFEHQGEIVNNGWQELIEDLDLLPFPARHLTKIDKYSSLLAKGKLITTMITSRGCPYKCLFCHRPHLGKKFRARSAANVVHEIEECINMGIKEILVYDDTFTIDRQRVIDICRLILERNLNFTWDIRTRVDTVDLEMLRALKKAGCERIHYGIESANPPILKVLRKGITLPQVESAFNMTKKAGISTLAYFMIGSPGETREQIMNTIGYAKRLEPDYCHFSITTPYPATPLYEMGLKKGLFDDYWREFAANPDKDFTTKFWEEDIDREELTQLLDYSYKNFYTRPGYLLRQMRKVRSFGEFARKAKAGLRLLKH